MTWTVRTESALKPSQFARVLIFLFICCLRFTYLICLLAFLTFSCQQPAGEGKINDQNASLDSLKNLMKSENFQAAIELIESLETHLLTNKKLTRSDSVALSSLSNDRGRIAYYSGDLGTSINYLKAGLKLDSMLRDTLAQAIVERNIGLAYKNIGQHEEAIRFYLRALTKFRFSQDTAKIAAAYNSLGNLYNTIDDYDLAFEYLEQARLIWEKLGTDRQKAMILNNLANAQVNTGSMDLAMGTYLKSLKIKRQIGSERSIAITLINVGDLLLAKGNYKGADSLYHLAFEGASTARSQNLIATALSNLAKVRMHVGDYTTALRLLDSAFQVAIDPSASFLLENLKIKRDVYEKMGDFERALNTAELHRSLDDSLINQKKIAILKTHNSYDLAAVRKEKLDLIQQNELQLGKIGMQRALVWVLVAIFVGAVCLILLLRKREQSKRKRHLTERNRPIEFKTNLTINTSKIVYGKADKNNTILFLDNGKSQTLSQSTFQTVLNMLPQEYFVQVQKSYFVNLLHYKSHQSGSVSLLDGRNISLGGQKFRVQLEDKLRNFITREQNEIAE